MSEYDLGWMTLFELNLIKSIKGSSIMTSRNSRQFQTPLPSILRFLTAAAVLGITFTPPPLFKRMKNVVKKLNWVLPNVTSKIWTKSIRPMVCALNNCFCRQKARMNFTKRNFKNMDNFKLIFSFYSTVSVTRFDIPYQLLPYFQNF